MSVPRKQTPIRITKLPTELANQIAAGEVVERPASVVKELVENALDAGATRVLVTVELGGKRLVRVEDDGEGMTLEEALLSLERHATSKIKRLEDLAAIESLGFRGEALPSIASVSHLSLRTRLRGDRRGCEIKVSGGAIIENYEVGASEGTTVEVTDLFYNVPARRKFLKSDGAETAQISKLVTQLALGHHKVGFGLVSGTRQLLQCPEARSLSERLFQLYGDRSNLVQVDKTAAGVRISGFATGLAAMGTSVRRGPQNVFVNGRAVKDRTIIHAIRHAYDSATNKERTPEVHLFLDLPPDRVDVNVHPGKAEVRFLEQSLVHEVLRRALGEALGSETAPELTLGGQNGVQRQGFSQIPEEPSVYSRDSKHSAQKVLQVAWRDAGESIQSGLVPELPQVAVEASPFSSNSQLIPLGQFRNTFIVAIDDEGIAIIDQHVAHERVLYEQMMERLTEGSLESQRLLAPMVLELPPGERLALTARDSALSRLGFELGEFGGDSVRVSALPVLVPQAVCETAIRELAQDLDGLDQGSAVDDVLRQIAATTACHAAVKANDRLTRDKMVYILDELGRTAHSSVCPHGRPVVLRLSRRQLEKHFDRI